MTGSGYYDYAPTLTLSRPVAFCGHPGCGYREVVYDLASLTGLPLHDLDHWVEHEAGRSLWSLARREGLAALREAEARLLPRALASPPPGLVLLGEGTLTEPGPLRRVREAAGLVFLRLPPTACYWSLRRRAEARGGILGHPDLPDRLSGADDLRPLFEAQGPAAEAADLVLDMEGRSVHEAVLDLQRELPALGGARPHLAGEAGSG